MAGIELIHMIMKGHMIVEVGEQGQTPAAQCDSLAAYSPHP